MAELRKHTINTLYMVGPVHCYSAMLHGELVLFDTDPPTRSAQQWLHPYRIEGNLQAVTDKLLNGKFRDTELLSLTEAERRGTAENDISAYLPWMWKNYRNLAGPSRIT